MGYDELNHRASEDAADAADGDETDLTQAELDAFRQALPFMFRRFPEMRRLRPEQLAADDPVRGVLDEFLSSQRRHAKDALDKGVEHKTIRDEGNQSLE
jgi:hypothetical protein